MKRVVLILIILFSSLSADMLRVEAKVGYEYLKLSDSLRQNGSKVYVEPNANRYTLSARFEHFVPLVPDIKVNLSVFDFDDSQTLQNINFKDTAFVKGSSVDIELRQLDMILYYEILDNIVNLDVGVNLKLLDSKAKVYNSSVSKESSSMNLVPMLYASARIDLPFTNLSLNLDANALYYDSDEYHDVKLSLIYESDIGFGYEVGFRDEVLKNYISPIDSQVTMRGITFEIFYNF